MKRGAQPAILPDGAARRPPLWLRVSFALAAGGASAAAQLPPPVVADLVVPGSKRIESTMSIEPSPALAGRKLVVHRAFIMRDWSPIAPGESFAASGKYGTCVHLARDGADPILGPEGDCAEPCVRVDTLRATGDQVSVYSTVQAAHTVLRVARVSDDELVLEVVSHERRRDPWMITGLALILLAGAASARWAWTRRARKH
jgi:hypothetical protein